MPVPGLPTALDERLDENLTCRALIDNDDLGIDLSGVLLYQTPEAARLRARLTEIETSGRSDARALTAPIDARFAALVRQLSQQPPGASLSVPDAVRADLARLADDLDRRVGPAVTGDR